MFTKKKRLKGKDISITESLTKIRMSALVVVARNKCGYRGVWTVYRKMKRSKLILVELVTNSNCATEKQELFLFLMTLLCLFGDFIQSIPKRKLLCRFNTLYMHTTFNFNKKLNFTT